MQASQAYTKASQCRTIAECNHALDDIRETIANFELSRGEHLHYLNKLYEEQHAYVQRRRALERSPSPEMQLERIRNTLRMINFRAVEGLRGGAPTVLCHDIMRLAREALYDSEK